MSITFRPKIIIYWCPKKVKRKRWSTITHEKKTVSEQSGKPEIMVNEPFDKIAIIMTGMPENPKVFCYAMINHSSSYKK